MKKEDAFDDRLAAVWKRVELSRAKTEGGAALMPRKKKKGLPLRPIPDGGGKKATS